MTTNYIPSNPAVAWHEGWQTDPATTTRLAAMAPGDWITVVKRHPEGHESTRYRARAIIAETPSPWIELIAVWSTPKVSVAGLDFVPGDIIREFFSAEHPYNAFAVIGTDGALRGWYGNVTYPAFIDTVDGTEVLVWHDLFLDVVVLPTGKVHLLDDDELEDSDLPEQHPDLARAIAAARLDLIALIKQLSAT